MAAFTEKELPQVEMNVLGVDGVAHQVLGPPRLGGLPPAARPPARGGHVAVEHRVAQHGAYGGGCAPGVLVPGREKPRSGSAARASRIGAARGFTGNHRAFPAPARSESRRSAQGSGVPPVAFMISPVMNEAFAEARKT
ncbi:hypothetical protein EES46_29975 [Streptomyces sp. ADI98-10]|nr:hypothetical protein EES46_29975 [Streptomyces sp. ADI98-10]